MASEGKKDLEEILLPSFNPSLPRSDFDWNPSSVNMKRFNITIRTLQLDHSEKWWSFVSWTVGILMILVIPILRLIFLKPADKKSNHELVFQPIVVVVGILISGVSFIFLSESMRKYGIQGILHLDIAAEETSQIREEYNKIIQVLNLVNLTGIGICLKYASKIAHMHRRIVKAASTMHAKTSRKISEL